MRPHADGVLAIQCCSVAERAQLASIRLLTAPPPPTGSAARCAPLALCSIHMWQQRTVVRERAAGNDSPCCTLYQVVRLTSPCLCDAAVQDPSRSVRHRRRILLGRRHPIVRDVLGRVLSRHPPESAVAEPSAARFTAAAEPAAAR